MFARAGGRCRGRCGSARRLVSGDGARQLEEVCIRRRRGDGRLDEVLLLDEEVGIAWQRRFGGES